MGWGVIRSLAKFISEKFGRGFVGGYSDFDSNVEQE